MPDWLDIDNFDEYPGEPEARGPDLAEEAACNDLREFFGVNQRQVFYTRQLQIQNEKTYFHWIVGRALHRLVDEGLIRSEERELAEDNRVVIYFHRSHRYYARGAGALIKLINEYAIEEVSEAVGRHGELLVLEGFTRFQFLHRGQHTNTYSGRAWTKTAHNLDYIFERDGQVYGVEVKNTLNYMDRREFDTKIELCLHLGIRPVFAVRMIPRIWIPDLDSVGGYAMIMKYLMYPRLLRRLAERMRNELGLPVDTPRALLDGTMQRFVNWHLRNL
jgi:hypothetical protein